MCAKKKQYDHLGNEYESLKAMCEHYGISVNGFYYRIKEGCSLKNPLKYVDNHNTYLSNEEYWQVFEETTGEAYAG